MKLFTTQADIVTAIESIRTTGKKLDLMIQTAACSIIAHVEKHGDITLINTLVDAMPNGSRVNALRDYMTNFSKGTYDDESKAFKFDKTKTTNQAGAEAIMWTEFSPEKPYVAFDLNALLAGLLKKADKALKDAPHEVDAELLAKLASVLEDTPTVEADPLVNPKVSDECNH